MTPRLWIELGSPLVVIGARVVPADKPCFAGALRSARRIAGADAVGEARARGRVMPVAEVIDAVALQATDDAVRRR